jgi:dTDP-4-amino-4,6-dideoxygalactose transaminase
LRAYHRYGHTPEQFPNAFRNQSRILSLPLFAEMTHEQQDRVVDSIRRFCAVR